MLKTTSRLLAPWAWANSVQNRVWLLFLSCVSLLGFPHSAWLYGVLLVHLRQTQVPLKGSHINLPCSQLNMGSFSSLLSLQCHPPSTHCCLQVPEGPSIAPTEMNVCFWKRLLPWISTELPASCRRIANVSFTLIHKSLHPSTTCLLPLGLPSWPLLDSETE